MLEYEFLKEQFQSLGCEVRGVTAQHGPITKWLEDRKCILNYVTMNSDPEFKIVDEYIAKGVELIKTTEEREQLVGHFYPNEKDRIGKGHNMVQPGLVVEDLTTNTIIYKWTWRDIKHRESMDGKVSTWKGEKNSKIVFYRPPTEDILAAIKRNDFGHVGLATYPTKWARDTFPYVTEKAKM